MIALMNARSVEPGSGPGVTSNDMLRNPRNLAKSVRLVPVEPTRIWEDNTDRILVESPRRTHWTCTIRSKMPPYHPSHDTHICPLFFSYDLCAVPMYNIYCHLVMLCLYLHKDNSSFPLDHHVPRALDCFLPSSRPAFNVAGIVNSWDVYHHASS